MQLPKRKSVIKVFIINKINEQCNTAIDNYNVKNKYDIEPEKKESIKRLAFENEAIPHIKALCNYAFGKLGNKLDADDMVQETYLRAFRFFDSYEKGTNCKAWLFRIMKNVINDKLRQRAKESVNIDFEDAMNYIHNIKSVYFDLDDFHEKMYSKLLDDEMMSALNSVNDDFKTAVILYDLEGLSCEEIAEFLNCPMGTVRSRLHRGRKLMQKKLSSYASQRGYNSTIAA